MKIKTQDLIGDPLDWAVGFTYRHSKAPGAQAPISSPSTNWAQGGPIIEREGLLIRPQPGRTIWDSWVHGADNPCYTQGPTPLIAAMRCYVTSRLGDEVEIPSEIYNTLVVQIVIE